MILALAALLVAISLPGLASAHEKRTVAGRYTFVVGFLDEPAYAGIKNSIDLTICDGNACNYVVKDGARVVDNPVNDAQKTLKVEVIFGGQAALPLDLAARYGQPGKYQGFFLPAKAGSYTFHLSGQLNGQAVDERFVSSPKTFSDAEELKSYPSNDTTSSERLQAVLKPTKGNQMQHFTRTGSKNAALIVETKPDLSKTILKIVLGQQLELTGVALTHKGAHSFWNTMAEVGLGVTTQVCGTFTDAAKLLYL